MRFEEDHVRLSNADRARLAGFRDTNLDRLQEGLGRLGPLRGVSTYRFARSVDQGSYPMFTMIQHPENGYDIDTAVIFPADALPASPRDARRRVVDAFSSYSALFTQPPEARTNAVTVWYQDGHHVDLAIYRERTEWGVATLEHAGAAWTPRDPRAITTWFTSEVDRQSPAASPDRCMPEGQLRRIVRYLKAFGCSREWRLPGGLLMAVLAAENYRPHPTRDDEALYNTMGAIALRLHSSTHVYNPVAPGVPLTTKEEHHAQLRRFRDRLDEARTRLRPLLAAGCTDAQAMEAWGWVFRHVYWTDQKAVAAAALADGVAPLSLRVSVARQENGTPFMQYRPDGAPLLKRLWLRFEIENYRVQPWHRITWIVENHGAEAEAANDLGHDTTTTSRVHWEQTAYRGEHFIICEVREATGVVARGRHVVRIGAKAA